jgi:hypothetical protein
MTPKSSYLFCVLVLIFPTTPLRAQDSTRARSDSNLTLLDLTIDPTVNEPYRIFLAKGVVYRASFDQPGITIRMRSYEARQLPFLVPVTQTDDASGRSEYELYPQADGVIEFLAVFNELRVPVHFRLWSDARATARGRRSAAEGYWEVGLDLYAASYGTAVASNGAEGEGTSAIGGCFSFRNGPGIARRLNGCAFGMEVLAGEGDALDRSRFYIEPRFRILGASSDHTGWGPEAGALLSIGTSQAGPYLGPGIYGALDYRNGEGDGLRLMASLRYDWESAEILTDPILSTDTEQVSIWTPSVRIGVGYYW